MNNDIIFAQSSGIGKSGVAVIRISGNNLSNLFSQIIHKKEFDNRHAYFTNLYDKNNKLIDQCIAVYFNAPKSFTGEDIIEIHSHGAPAVIQKIFEYLTDNNARIANRGEFSQRAFYNNKMDLTDVDGLIALLNAQTDNQRKSALKSMLGEDSKTYTYWRNQMIEISAYAAAIMDYAEDDLPQNIKKEILQKTKLLYTEIEKALANYNVSKTIQNGFNIVLVGETNVGKSSIFNKIVGTNRAIVSEIPGTTRDVINSQIDIDGFLVNISDTAGIRDTKDTIEQIGIERTKSEIENANLIIHVQCDENHIELQNNEILIINKSDLLKNKHHFDNKNIVYTSAINGNGFDKLMNIIRDKIHSQLDNYESNIVINNRTYNLLKSALNELSTALSSDINYDIFAEQIRHCADIIGKILGTITTEEVMNETFSQLCLGK